MTGGPRSQIPTSDTVDRLLRKHLHVVRTSPAGGIFSSRERTRLIEALLRHSYLRNLPGDPGFVANGRRVDVRLRSAVFRGRDPSDLGARLQRAVLELDTRFREPPPVAGLETLDLLLGDETVWALRVEAIAQGRPFRWVAAQLVHRSLLEMKHVYGRAGRARVEVPIPAVPTLVREVSHLVNGVGGEFHPSVEHHLTLKTGGLQGVPA